MPYAIDRYLNVKAAYMPSFSSDGRRLAFISDLTGVPQAWRVPLDDLPGIPMPEQLTFAEDRVLWLRCSPVPGDERILLARDRGGDENARLYLLDPAQGHETCLTPGYDRVVHIPGHWSAGGRAVLFAANRDHPARFGLYRCALDGSGDRLLWQSDEPGFIDNAHYHPAGDRVLFSRIGLSAAHDLLEVDITTGRARHLNPPDRPARYHSATYSPDGRHAYVVSDLDSDRYSLLRLDLAAGTWETLIAPLYDLEHFALSPNGRYIVFTLNQDGYSRLERLDLAQAGAHPSPPLPDGVLGMLDETIAFAAASTAVAFSYATAASASNIYVWDWAGPSSTIRPLTRMTQGGIPPAAFVRADLVRYPTFDGRDIPAWLYRPPAAAAPAPVVVIVHGGPESQARPWFDFVAQYLVNRGYAVLVPNVRGSSGYGNAYSHLDDVEKRLDSVNDLAHAAHWLRSRPEFDARRIAVLGGSYGGYMVLAALAFHPELWAAGVDIVGIANFVTFLENTSDYRRRHRESEYGRLDTDRAFLEHASPINHVERITAPLLVIHGANDPRVPLSEAEQLVARLSALGRPVELMVFDDEGHGIKLLKNKRVAYPAIARFLDRALQRGESDAA